MTGDLIKIDYGNRHSVELKRYVLFAYSNYYPSGAKNDMKATSDSVYALKHYAYDVVDINYDHMEILDMDERKWYEPRDF